MDKSISEFIEALSVLDEDLYVLEQGGEAKKLKWSTFIKFAAARLDGHGGIQNIALIGTSGLVDTHTITMSDGKTYDIVVKNGRGISEFAKTATSGLADTYTISYNDGTAGKFTVTNGEKGDKGDNAYVWIKYASQEPTESSHFMGDLPDDWIGIYSGNSSIAPTDWKQYKWFQIKGEKGDTGSPSTLVAKSVTYQVSDSGTITPSGSWSSSIPVVSQGKYLWTKTEVRFNSGDPIVSYSVSRMGIDGSGSVSSVAGVSPDETGNVTLTAADVGALAVSGGDMEGAINMNGQPISGLNDPTEGTQAARKGYVDAAKAAANAYTDASVRKAAPRNLLDNSDFRNPVNQRGKTAYFVSDMYVIDRWFLWSENAAASASVDTDGIALNPFSDTSVILGQRFQKGYLSNNRTYTLAYLDNTGEIHIRYNPVIYGDSFDSIEISSPAWIKLVWAALYEGEYTAETLPEYQPKGYGAELAECQRYFYRYNGLVYLATRGDGYQVATVNFPVTMRAIPNIVIHEATGNVLCEQKGNMFAQFGASSNAFESVKNFDAVAEL